MQEDLEGEGEEKKKVHDDDDDDAMCVFYIFFYRNSLPLLLIFSKNIHDLFVSFFTIQTFIFFFGLK
mgnify:CR=1 FL=1